MDEREDTKSPSMQDMPSAHDRGGEKVTEYSPGRLVRQYRKAVKINIEIEG